MALAVFLPPAAEAEDMVTTSFPTEPAGASRWPSTVGQAAGTWRQK